MVWALSASFSKSRIDFVVDVLFKVAFEVLGHNFFNKRFDVFEEGFNCIAESVGILTQENVVCGLY